MTRAREGDPMRRSPILRSLIALAALAVAAPTGADDTKSPVVARVRAELARYYETEAPDPLWSEAAARAAAGDRAKAGYLRALLEQARLDADQQPRGDRTRDLHRPIIAALENGGAPEALPVIAWLLDHAGAADVQAGAAAALVKLSGSRVRELALKPHANALVARRALEELGRRGVAIEAAELRPLCHHHRESLRQAARALARKLGHPEPGAFQASKALAPLKKALLPRIQALILDPPPAGAPFVEARIRFEKGRSEPRVVERVVRGWLLSKTGAAFELLSPFGWQESIPRRRDRRSWSVTLSSLSAEQEVARVMALRAPIGDEGLSKTDRLLEELQRRGQLSERGMLSREFEREGFSAYELMLGLWLIQSGREELAARLWLPLLDNLRSDEELFELARDHFGKVYGYQMLSAFAGDRDYERALTMARAINARLPGSRFSEYALALAEQLPRRSGDFTDLALPTRQGWRALRRRSLSRAQRIQYLCDRLRLLNAFQQKEPEGVDLSQAQFAEPVGISRDAAWSRGKARTRVINPYRQLTGPRRRGLGLRIADIPTLAPYLKEDWLVPSIGFWRDFHPSRGLWTTRELLAQIINRVAHQRLIDPAALKDASEEEVATEIEAVIAWAREHSGAREPELLMAALERELEKKERELEKEEREFEKGGWAAIEEQAEALAELKVKRAVPVFERFLDLASTDAFHRRAIIALTAQIHRPAGARLARRFLDSEHATLRVQAALTLFEAGDRELARPILARLLGEAKAEDVFETDISDAAVLLLREGSAESIAAARGVFEGSCLLSLNDGGRPAVCRVFARQGFVEPYLFYRRALQAGELTLNKQRVGLAQLTGELIEEFAWDSRRVRAIARRHYPEPERVWAEERPEVVVELNSWLDDRVRVLGSRR